MKKKSVIISWACSYVIILLIPVIAVFVNYICSIKVIKEENLQANELVLDNISSAIDRYLYQEMSVSASLIQSRNFVKIISGRKKDAQFYYDAAQLRSQIASLESDMTCMVYLKKLDYVICNTGANESAAFYNGMRNVFPQMAGYEEWFGMLEREYQNEFFISAILMNCKADEACLIYADSVREWMQYESFNIFIGLPVSTLEELTRSLSEGSRLLVKLDGKTVLALTNLGMEEASAEEEGATGSSEPIETERYMEISKTSSEVKNIEYCIIIPKDEFWKELQQIRNVLLISLAVTFVVGLFCVSAVLNRNFKPMASLVEKIGGNDGKKGNEYKLIEDAYFRLMGEKDIMYQRIISQKEQMQSSYLLSVLKGRAMETEEDIIPLQAGQKIALAGFLIPLSEEGQTRQDEVVRFVVDNIFTELMEGYTFYRTEDGPYFFYLFQIQTEGEEWKQSCLKAMEYLCAIVREKMEVSVYGAVSGIVDDPEKIRFLYQDIMQGFESGTMLLWDGVIDTEAGSATGAQGIVNSVMEYVKEHYQDTSLNISMIAEGIGKNPKYISRVFKEETQEGILDYVNRLRIRKAQVLIRSGQFTLEQVSEMVGYASVRTFRRAFQKETGKTPGALKQTKD